MSITHEQTYLMCREAIAEVLAERHRQLAKFGVQDHPIADWFLILGEEVGEAQREACEHVFRLRFPDHYPDDPRRLHRLRKELIEVAAVAVAMVESLDRNELNGSSQTFGGDGQTP